MKVQSMLWVTDGFTKVPMKIEAELDFYEGDGDVMSVSNAVIKGPWYLEVTDQDISKFANEGFRKLAIGQLVKDARSMRDDLRRGPFGPDISADEEAVYRAREDFEARR